MMNIYIFEYFGDYVGGTAVVVAETLESACEMLGNVEFYPTITDEDECLRHFLFTRLGDLYHVDGVPVGRVKQRLAWLVEQHCPLEKKEKFLLEFGNHLEKEGNTLSGGLRLDWALRPIRKKLQRGIYFIVRIPTHESVVPGIVSHTFHEG